MPRKNDSTLEDLFEIGLANPKIGLALAGVLGLAGAALTWVWPKAALGFAQFVGMFMLLLAAAAVIASLIGFAQAGARERRLDRQRTIEDLKKMTWQQFEQLVADAYRRKGFRVHEVGGQGDGGGDLILHGASGSIHPVQCKQWRTWSVGAPKVREFVGACADTPDANHGIYVTCGTYTVEARALAKRHGIELLDGHGLVELVTSVNGQPVPQPTPVMATPVAATPSCPVCNGDMVRRTAKKGANAGQDFWGCALYPKCRGTRPATAEKEHP